MFVNNDLQTEHSYTIIQQLIINNNQLFNICQHEYYCVTHELKCHNFCSKYPRFSNTSVKSHESPTTFSCYYIISHQCWSNL